MAFAPLVLEKETPPGLPRWPAGLCATLGHVSTAISSVANVVQKPLNHRDRPGGVDLSLAERASVGPMSGKRWRSLARS